MTSGSDRFYPPAREESAEDRLRFQADVLAAVRDSVICTDLEGRIIFWNAGATEVFGYTADEMIGGTPAVLYPTARPEDLQVDLAAIMAGDDFTGTWEGRRKDGRVVWVDIKTTVMRDSTGVPIGFIGVAKDATARKEAETALARSEHRYRMVSLASREALWEWDLATGRVEWSRGAETMLGYDPVSLGPDGTLWPRQLHPEDRPRVRARLDEAVAGSQVTWSDEYRVRRNDGSYAVMSDRAYIERDAEGRAIRVVGAMVDISARKRAEEHFRQTDRLEAVGRLAGGVAHDINNMLMSVLGWADLLGAHVPTDAPGGRELEQITRSATRSATLIRQLLAFARRDMLRPESLDVNAVVTETAALVSPILEPEIDFRLNLAPDLDRVWADRSRLEQCVVNLVINARDALPGIGSITIETARVRLDAAYAETHAPTAIEAGEYVLVAVSDTGKGMDRETLGRIFEPFFTTKPTGEGTGLGLASVYGSVKQAGGLVWAYSEPGLGTVVKIYWPTHRHPPEAARGA